MFQTKRLFQREARVTGDWSHVPFALTCLFFGSYWVLCAFSLNNHFKYDGITNYGHWINAEFVMANGNTTVMMCLQNVEPVAHNLDKIIFKLLLSLNL